MDNIMAVPKEINHPFFFPNGEANWMGEEHFHLNVKELFIHELAYYQDTQSLKPWEMQEESIVLLLAEWGLVKDELRSIFEKRNHNASRVLMKKGIGFFIEFLHWTNGKPVLLIPAIAYESFQIKPINIKERLEFILSRPNSYHSYMQLGELMSEMEKVYRKQLAIKGIKRSV